MNSKVPDDLSAGAIQEPPAASEAVVRLESTDGEPLAEWLCTPDRLEALTLGWLFSEGIVAGTEDISSLGVESACRVRVRLSELARQRLASRRTAAGPGPAPARISAHDPAGPYRPGPALEDLLSDAPRLAELFRDMFDSAAVRTPGGGGLHTGALVIDGGIVDVVEDVSRSAIIDKLVGSALLEDGVPEQSLFLLSGRISASIAAKLSAAGIAAAATISIPTTLAVEIAGRSGVALVGRSRRDSPYRYGTG
jgi:FdhD protein